jgi:hypothetical protein
MKYFIFLALGFASLLDASAFQTGPAGDEDVDFSLANLTLTAGDEKELPIHLQSD